MNTQESSNKELLSAAKYAVRVLADANAGGNIETAQQMKIAQQKLFNAIKNSDPTYYGFPEKSEV